MKTKAFDSIASEKTKKWKRGRGPGRRPEYKFTIEKQAEYLKLLAHGGRRHASAYKIGITPALICAARKRDPEFNKAMLAAELIANEHVESSLYKSAINGNVTAQQVWLYNRMPEKWRDARHRDGNPLSNTYNYNFYMPDNQRTIVPIVHERSHADACDPEANAVFILPSNERKD